MHLGVYDVMHLAEAEFSLRVSRRDPVDDVMHPAEAEFSLRPLYVTTTSGPLSGRYPILLL